MNRAASGFSLAEIDDKPRVLFFVSRLKGGSTVGGVDDLMIFEGVSRTMAFDVKEMGIMSRVHSKWLWGMPEPKTELQKIVRRNFSRYLAGQLTLNSVNPAGMTYFENGVPKR